MGKARMRVDKTERCLDKLTFPGKVFPAGLYVSIYRFRFVIGSVTLRTPQLAPYCFEWVMFTVRISEDDCFRGYHQAQTAEGHTTNNTVFTVENR